jgi:outer membrane lipoprotein-sorting protein
MDKIKMYLTALLLLVATTVMAQKDSKARAVLDKTAAVFTKGGTTMTQFSLQGVQGNAGGKFTMKGKKFVLRTADVVTWFDGTTQWSYLPSSNEVNITTPTGEELHTINPYAFLTLYKKGFNYTMTETKSSGKACYQVTLTPEKKQEIQQIVLVVDKSNYHPYSIRIKQGGKVSTITVSSIQTNLKLGDDAFRFSSKKYPNAEVIDLR